MKNTRLILIPVLVFILSSIFLVLGIKIGLFGEAREGLMKFCEHARDGYVKQPANSFSNLGFSLVGLIMVFQIYLEHFKERNAFTTNDGFPIILSIGLIITGAGSFAMHATNGHWGGFSDLLGMFLIASFVFAYALKRVFNLNFWSFFLVYSIGVILSSIVYLSPTLNFKGFMSGAEVCFIFMLVVGICLELYLIFIKGMKVKKSYGYASILSLFVAFFIWNLSIWPDSVWCNPHSLLQGHAI